MAHYAFLNENNIVTEVIVGIDEHETIEGQDPETWYGNFRGQRCVRTSYNGRIRKQYASIGYAYDESADLFYWPHAPFPSWTLDANFDWQPPVPMPTEPGPWQWNEESQTWVENGD